MAAETVHERSAVVTRFGRWWVMVMAVSAEALTPGTASVVAVMIGGPPPSNNSTREVLVRWVDDASSSGNGS
jgi:hypothetical protein